VGQGEGVHHVAPDRADGARRLHRGEQADVESSYERLLDLLHAHRVGHPFLLGSRPGCGDLGVFGQLKQLVGWDPVSARIAVQRAPRVVNWVERLDDLS